MGKFEKKLFCVIFFTCGLTFVAAQNSSTNGGSSEVLGQLQRFGDNSASNTRGVRRPNVVTVGNALQPQKMWRSVTDPGPYPQINFNLGNISALSAGDVNGDGVNDYLYATAVVQDERTPDNPSDRTAKSIVYFGGLFKLEPDQVVYSQLFPIGDFNSDGFDDALGYDGVTSYAYYLGSVNGYQLQSAAALDQTLQKMLTFHDLDGDGYEDVFLFESQSPNIQVLWGDANLQDTKSETYTSFFEESLRMTIGDLDSDGQPEIVGLTGASFSISSKLSIYRFDSARKLIEVEHIDYPSFDGLPRRSSMFVANVDTNEFREVVVASGSANSSIDIFLQADAEGLLNPEPFRIDNYSWELWPAGDINDDGIGDFYRLVSSNNATQVLYGPLIKDGIFRDDDYSNFFDESYTLLPVRNVIGDLDADGIDDLLIGLSSQERFGRRIVAGSPERSLNATDVLYDYADFPKDEVRYTANVNDLNQDGLDDFAFAHRSSWPPANRVEVFWGGSALPDTPALVFRHSDHLRPSTLAAGDFNDDEYPDIAITFLDQYVDYNKVRRGEEEISGGLYVYFGSSNMDTEADYILLTPH